MDKENMKMIRLTREELKWIERTADIESAMAMEKFTKLCFSLGNKTEIEKLNQEEKDMIKDISKELIDLYLFLRELRTKLELWDCRYDIDSELQIKPDKLGEKK